jgi:hypothetical protein
MSEQDELEEIEAEDIRSGGYRIAELEAKMESALTLYRLGEECRTGLEAECNRLEVENAELKVSVARWISEYNEKAVELAALEDGK